MAIGQRISCWTIYFNLSNEQYWTNRLISMSSSVLQFQKSSRFIRYDEIVISAHHHSL